MKKTRLLACMLIILLVAGLAACTSTPEPAPPAAPPSGGQESAPPAETAVTFPTGPVEIVVGFGAGGGTHLAAELLVPEAIQFLGHPIHVVPIPGAGGAIGAATVAAAPADGYMLLYATMSLPISLHMDTVDFAADDFVGVALASDVAPVLAVRADAPFDTAEEMIAWIAENPGEFSWGHPGVGSTLHVLGANMLFATDVVDAAIEIPFASTAEAIAGVLGGHITAVSAFPATVLEQVAAGEMKIIGVSAPQRIDELPDAPTFIEQGFNATLTSTRGIFAPAATPQAVIDILEQAFFDIMHTDDFFQRSEALGEPPAWATAAEFDAMYREQLVMIEALLLELGLIG